LMKKGGLTHQVPSMSTLHPCPSAAHPSLGAPHLPLSQRPSAVSRRIRSPPHGSSQLPPTLGRSPDPPLKSMPNRGWHHRYSHGHGRDVPTKWSSAS
jgi:hypothetical protein